MNPVHFSSATDEWPTPPWPYAGLHAEFGFTLDPCATPQNAKCRKFFTRFEDGLSQDWSGETVFMNPPYGRVIGRWVQKAYETSHSGSTVVCLLPARTDARWWHDHMMKGEGIDMEKKTGDSTEKWIEFEHYQYIARGGGEDSDPEIDDVCYRLRAKVVNPEPEKALEGKVHSWRYEDDGQYAIVDTREGYLAICMDYHVPQGRFRDYQFRSVVLEEPARPLAWEVYTRNEVDSWTPVEGQHLRPRCADGAHWLQEISRASDRLRERERDLTETRRILLEAVGHPLVENGSESGKRVLSQLESKTDLKAADHALAAVKKEISRADELMRHLAGLRGTAVTLQQSAIEGRNLERIPTPVVKEQTAPTISAGHRLRV